MSNNSFLQFVESFQGITSIIPINEFEKSFSKSNLSLKKQNDLTYSTLPYNQKSTLNDLPEILQILYKAYLEREFNTDICCTTLNKNLLVLQKAKERISDPYQRNLKKSYDKIFLKSDCSQFWECYYELDIMAYFETIGSLTYIEPPNGKTTIDFHAEIKKHKIHVEIMTLSDIGNDKVKREHYQKLNKIFCDIFDVPLTYNLSQTEHYKFKKRELDRIEEFLQKNETEILSTVHNGNKFIFDLFANEIKIQKDSSIDNNDIEDIIKTSEWYPKLAQFKVYILEGHCGDGITVIDEFKYYNWDNYSKKITKKYTQKSSAFPINELNFILINISTSNPLFRCYFDRERESQKIRDHIEKGDIAKPYSWYVIDKFENILKKYEGSENLTGIILHRYKSINKESNRKIKVYQNPNSILKIPKVLYEAIEV